MNFNVHQYVLHYMPAIEFAEMKWLRESRESPLACSHVKRA